MGPRCRVGLEVGPHRGGEQPGTDDVVTLGPEVHRVGALIEVRILLPAADDLGGERRGGPGVHHIRVADEPTRRPPLGLVVASRSVGGRVDGQGVLGGGKRIVPQGLAGVVEAVPQWDGHPEEALPADQPVAVEAVDPVGVPGLHVGRVPVHVVASGDERFGQVAVPSAVGDVPLAGGDDLQGPVALLEELDRVGYGLWFADQFACLGEHDHHLGLGRVDGLVGQAGVGSGRRGVETGGRFGGDAALPVDDGPHREVQLPPPGHVGGVAEGTDHGNTGSLVGIGQPVGPDGYLDAEHRGDSRAVEQRLVAGVVGMGNQGHAGRHQFRSSGGHVDVAAFGGVEGQRVVGARAVTLFEFGLGDGRVEGGVPQGGCLHLVGLAAGQVAQEGPLGGPLAPLIDGGVAQGPVHR